MSAERSDRERALVVERFARWFESTGHTRIAGRVLGHLFTSDEPHVSLSALARDLGVSKASVSTNARVLIVQRFLTEAVVPGSRETHYAVVPDGPVQALDAAIEATAAVVALTDDALALVRGTVTPGAIALQSMRDTYSTLHDLMVQQRPQVGSARPRQQRDPA